MESLPRQRDHGVESVEPHRGGEDDLVVQLTSGSTEPKSRPDHPPQHLLQHAEAVFVGAQYDVDKDVMVSWLP